MLSSYVAPFLSLQYPTATPAHPDSFPQSTYYGAGKLDICIVISCVAIMAVLRDAFRLWFFEPLARWKLLRDLELKQKKVLNKVNGSANDDTNHHHHVTNRNGNANGNGHANGKERVVLGTRKQLRQLNHSVLRFAEQGWSVIYYSFQLSFGIYVHVNLPTRILDPIDLWPGYPHIPHPAPVKLYYLTQTAFYLHQILILNAEARRKDHIQMMVHHIITVFLMVTSYFTNFTRVGCVIMVLMDCCDIFLPAAKMIRYLNISQFACDLVFGCFMLFWIVTRHVLFLSVILSLMFTAPRIIEMQWTPENGYFFDNKAHFMFCGLLVALQILQCIWFWMICKVAYRVLTGSGASDDRSEEDSDDDSDIKIE